MRLSTPPTSTTVMPPWIALKEAEAIPTPSPRRKRKRSSSQCEFERRVTPRIDDSTRPILITDANEGREALILDDLSHFGICFLTSFLIQFVISIHF